MKELVLSDKVSSLLKDIEIPRMFKVKQSFECENVEPKDIPGIIEERLNKEAYTNQVRKGMRIAITAGSRGVANAALIIRSIVNVLKKKGALPFIIPAMGSHGGSTAEGQLEILTSLGITEKYCGCEIISSMDVVKIGSTGDNLDVYIDKNAYEADGIIIFNRIKPHTSFRGSYESGIMKMMAIGLGKQRGAASCHSMGFKCMGENVDKFGRIVLDNAPILLAIASIENAFDETADIIDLSPKQIIAGEPELLKEAYKNMPCIYLNECDVLIVDEIGKNISGCGMDPNITGRFDTPYAYGGIKAERVAVLSLSEETHGNGIGIGVSDVITEKVITALDLETMYTNAITTTIFKSSNIPIIVKNDKEAIQLCIRTCTIKDKENIRIIRIKNTLQIEQIMVSEALLDDAKSNPRLTIESEPMHLKFDNIGNLI